MKKRLPRKIDVEYIGCEKYRLLKSLHYIIDGEKFVVEKGFITDFASVPKVFWGFFPPDKNYAFAAVLHDWLYATKPFSRKKADKVFYRAMVLYDIDEKVCKLFYYIVRLFGYYRWKKARRKNEG